MKKIILLITLITQFTFSQDFKFGKVSKAELEESQHALESEASAAVLYRSQDVSIDYIQGLGFIQQNHIHERIKIYNKDGYKYATKQIRLYDENNKFRDELKNFKAYTYNLIDGKIDETKLKNEGVFEEKTNDYWKKTKFTMPNIKDGSVIEYKYTIQSKLLRIHDIPFQKLIPINKLDFIAATPEYYLYKTHLNPKASFYPKFIESKKNRRHVIAEGDRGGFYVVNTSVGKYVLEYLENRLTSNLENIPALKEEIFVDNLSNYQAKLIMELRSVDFPNQVIKHYSTSWEDVTKSIYQSENFGKELDKDNYFKKDIEPILAGLTTPEEKAGAIYNYVKSKVKSNDLIGYYTDLGVSKAYKEGVGNVADINLMLVAMLRYAGLEANPVLVSTRSNGIPITATKSGFNYVIAAVELPEGLILLDASNKYATANILPEFILNWQGRLIREDDSSTWVSLQPQQNSKQVDFVNATINDDLSVSGKVKERLTNHLAFSHREAYNNESKEEHIRAIEKGKGDIEVSHVTVKAENELSKPILISYEYNLQNGIEEIADKLYFSSLLFFTPKENPFKQETRKYPIDYTYPVSEKYAMNIIIPEGYQVETLPENIKAQYNGNDGVFTYLINQMNNKLQVSVTLEINKVIILPQDYLEFKKFLDSVIKKQTEQIVLIKG